MPSTIENKWIRAAIPALLIHCSIGTVYCWSTFKARIAEQIGMSDFSVGWAFSLAIFFLGISAAFAGKMVEKDIHRASLLSCICFTTGMIGTGLFIQYTTGLLALIGIYMFYGCIMGIGLGIGYITPVKTLMLWFSKQKGLATGISIMGFGLAKAIATPFMELIQSSGDNGIARMFYVLGAVYFAMMLAGYWLLRKPEDWVEPHDTDNAFKLLGMFRNRTFIGIWLMFYLNIHCGLALISYEKQILKLVFDGAIAASSLLLIFKIVPSLTAAFNALGRIGFSTISDWTEDRNTVYRVIFSSCIVICAITLATFIGCETTASIGLGIITVLLLVVVNSGYGGGFSTLPALLSSRFGMDKISKIHGLSLSAWAVAGLTGNNMTAAILGAIPAENGGYTYVILADLLLYTVALVICMTMVTHRK